MEFWTLPVTVGPVPVEERTTKGQGGGFTALFAELLAAHAGMSAAGPTAGQPGVPDEVNQNGALLPDTAPGFSGRPVRAVETPVQQGVERVADGQAKMPPPVKAVEQPARIVPEPTAQSADGTGCRAPQGGEPQAQDRVQRPVQMSAQLPVPRSDAGPAQTTPVWLQPNQPVPNQTGQTVSVPDGTAEPRAALMTQTEPVPALQTQPSQTTAQTGHGRQVPTTIQTAHGLQQTPAQTVHPEPVQVTQNQPLPPTPEKALPQTQSPVRQHPVVSVRQAIEAQQPAPRNEAVSLARQEGAAPVRPNPVMVVVPSQAVDHQPTGPVSRPLRPAPENAAVTKVTAEIPPESGRIDKPETPVLRMHPVPGLKAQLQATAVQPARTPEAPEPGTRNQVQVQLQEQPPQQTPRPQPQQHMGQVPQQTAHQVPDKPTVVTLPRGPATVNTPVQTPAEGGTPVVKPEAGTPVPGKTGPQPGTASVPKPETPVTIASGSEVRDAAPVVEPRSPAPLQAVQEPVARQVVNRVLAELEQLRGQTGKVVRLELQLNPPQLGKVVVKLIWQTGGLEARFLTGDQTVRGAIEQAFPQLREALGRQDVNLLDVSADMARDNDGEPTRREPRGNWLTRSLPEQDEPEHPLPLPETHRAWVLNRLA